LQEIGVAESIFGDKFGIRCRISALTALAQTLLSRLKHDIGHTPSSLEGYLVKNVIAGA